MKNGKHPGGRPTKMTVERQKIILECIAYGMPRERAANYAGIGVTALYAFQAKFPQFQEMIKRAESKCELFDLKQIQKASEAGEWTASAWRLERRYPETWGKVDRHLIRMQQTAAPLPDQYIQAINRALGVRGELEYLGPAQLTAGNGDGAIDPEILPQD
jgi:transposase